ncbi:hypothetical protein [Bacillus mesophilum]|uniref:Uncharacterized protein n=1 Tax=Bacillus mesophilum TaxID=1071718 RepID=A0A7V7RLF1_9BACI|nr:hypothetical protein [Bacillus mesophilum]KAB2332544.1 hypothetical protein F7732_10630 [Bacillus mesophilum]
MEVLFGTVAYFEQEIRRHVLKEEKNKIVQIAENLELDLKFNFVCHEDLRKECLQNLSQASKKLLQATDQKLEKIPC